MNAPNLTEETKDPGANVVGCIKSMLAIPMIVFGLFAVFWGLVCLVFGGPEGKIGESELIIAGLMFLVPGLVAGGIGALMIRSHRKQPTSTN
jgi:ABC-type phosphate transport system permease subunit